MARWFVVCVLWCLAACTADVVAGLDEVQSQEALAALSRAGVGGVREAEGEGKARRYRIVVPAGDSGHAAEVLRAEGLPRAPEKGLAETYAASSMIPSTTEEHARWLKALAGEIAQQLERFDAVADASVIVTVPVPDPLAPPDAARSKPSAAVLLKLRAGAPAPAEDDVKKLVAAAVEGLAAADVAVVTQAMPRPPEAAPAFASVAGLHVARGSKGALVGVLGGALVIIIGLGVWVMLASRRR